MINLVSIGFSLKSMVVVTRIINDNKYNRNFEMEEPQRRLEHLLKELNFAIPYGKELRVDTRLERINRIILFRENDWEALERELMKLYKYFF